MAIGVPTERTRRRGRGAASARCARAPRPPTHPQRCVISVARLSSRFGGPIERGDEPKDRLAAILRDAVGLEITGATHIGRVEHLFTHRRLELDVFRARLAPGGRVRRAEFVAHRWLAPEKLLELAHAGPTRKAMTLLGTTDESSARAAWKRAP